MMIISTSAIDCVDGMQRYFEALARSDFDGIAALFGPRARVSSPWLGRLAPRDFHDRVGGTTMSSATDRREFFVSGATVSSPT